MTEFVAINERGEEKQWIDPVESIRETRCYWIVNNGYHTYQIYKRKGWKYITREHGRAMPQEGKTNG